MTEQQQAPQQPAPTAIGTAVEFSMAWLATQGDIGKMVQRTIMTVLQDNDQLQQVLQGQTQELASVRSELEGMQELGRDPEWLRAQLQTIPAKP